MSSVNENHSREVTVRRDAAGKESLSMASIVSLSSVIYMTML